MKSTQRNTPRRGWTLRGTATEVFTWDHVSFSFSLLVFFLGISALLVQTGCVGATAKSSAPATQSTTTTTNTTNNSAPSVSAQPANQSVTAGQTAAFSVAATGTAPLTYQWSKNGAPIGGAMSSSYITPATLVSDNGAQFSVTVSNAAGNVTSNGAVLSVTAAPVAPAISSQPAGQTVTAGQTATFSVAATGTAPLTYQWNKNGAAISGAISSSYITPATATSDSGAVFSVAVSNSVSSVTSGSAALTVNAPTYVISAAPSAFAFTGTVNGAAPAQQTVTFIATPATPLPFTMTANQPWITMSANSGTTKAILQFGANTTGMTAGTYNGQVLVTPSGAGNPPMTIPISLTLSTAAIAPSISTQPAGQSVTVGQTATFSVAAAGTAPLTYQWNKNGAAISGATSASYTTPATAIGDNGAQFSVTVSNTTGNVTSNNAALAVAAAVTAPSISTQPAGQSITVGQTATFSVVATGTAPLLYQWNKNGAAISGATAASYTTLAAVIGDNGAQFSVTVSNTKGLVTSNGAVLNVAPAPTAPSISTQPAGQTVTVGQTATFSVAATGTAPLAYQWNKNGAVISGATASSYTTPATVAGDNASTFSVTVSNSASSVTSNSATLTVNAVPFVISASPASFSFTAVANGAAPAQQTVTFISTPATPLPFTMTASQPWITMSASSGTTKAILQFGANTTGLSVGTYSGQVLVTPTGANNPPMTVPISLTITAAPAPGALTASQPTLNFNSVNVGSNSTLQTTLTNTGSTSIDITNVSISGAGFSVSGVPAGTILAAGQTTTLSVTFAPSASGSVTGSVSVASNASNALETVSLSGTGAAVVQHSVSLTWAETTGSVAGYNIYQSTVSGGSYTKVNSSLDSSQSYTDTTVQSGQTYYYVVTAVDPSGVESGFSSQVTVVIP